MADEIFGQLSPQELQAVAAAKHINVPIMAHRVVGDRLELFLYGGARVHMQIDGLDAPEFLAGLDLAAMGWNELYTLAQELCITGRSGRSKAQLVEMIEAYYRAEVKDS